MVFCRLLLIAVLGFCSAITGTMVSVWAQEALVAYCPMPVPDCALFIDEFKKDTGIEVNFTRIPTGEILARIRAEKSNPQADLWFGGPQDPFIQGASEGLFAPYIPEGLKNVNPRFIVDHEGRWTPFSGSIMSFTYNEELLKEIGANPPDSWQSFADPAFRGNVVLAHPAAAGTAYFVLAVMVHIYGEDEAIRIMKEIDKNVIQYTRTGAAGSRMVANGEVALSMVYLVDLENLWKEGYSSGVAFPKEGTAFSMDGFALIKGASESRREKAKAFIDWLLSERGQETAAATLRSPVVLNAGGSSSSIDMSQIKFIDYDFAWAGENRARLLERYEREVRQGSAAK